MQFIDTRTCRPIENLYVEIWHANATGVYSGVASIDNGDSLSTLEVEEGETGERKMTGGIVDESWLRGVQQTSADGVVRFETVMPGWYLEQLLNNTLFSPTSANHSVQASHVGQIFFDSVLLNRVAEAYPYHTNSQWRIKNGEDAVFMQEGDSSDPIVQYVMLGSGIEDGLMGWITIGIDPEVSVNIKGTASWFGSWGRMWKKLWR
ncbi:extracellular dioxygenase [Colletotrichum incanum]|nr:extracellular dioxygenase [Colletotrichum incanum]